MQFDFGKVSEGIFSVFWNYMFSLKSDNKNQKLSFIFFTLFMVHWLHLSLKLYRRITVWDFKNPACQRASS